MRKSYRCLAAWLLALFFSNVALAQTVTVSGTVRNSLTKETVPAATVRVKGTSQATFTDANGNFSLNVAKLPVTLIISSAEFIEQEINVTDASRPVSVDFVVNTQMGQEVVVSATRTAQRSLDAPVTVERMGPAQLRNLAAPSYYEAITNLKGVDVHTASLTFRTVTTRGFVSSGNTRLNQLIDGMDNQAPGLNFSVGSVVGLTELDVDNIEILSGASSALYGSGGINGTVLINSKNPFKYQGFSLNIKQGIMHVDRKQQAKAAPFYDWALRWAKAFNNKFAFKIAGELIKGSDWQADDFRNKQQIGILSKVVGGTRSSDPNFNGINMYGDETSASMEGFAFFVQDQTRRGVLAAGGPDLVLAANSYFGVPGNPLFPGAIGLNPYPTNTQVATFLSLFPAQLQPAVQQMLPFYIGLNRGYFHGASISRTGYEEENLVDYNTLNVKLTGGLHYKITENIEASINSYFGTGTTVYTGADRYSLRNLKIAQHKAEIKSKNWFARAYTTQENAGESYNATALGAFLNEAYRPSSVWFPTYIATFSETRRQAGPLLSDITIHNSARATVDAGRLLPGTPAFDAAVKQIRSTPIRKGGALFLDKSDLYAAEGQLNFSDALGFSETVEFIAGTNWKQWVMNSQGTIFADTADKIKVNEFGIFGQLKKALLDDVLTLSVAGRYDKQTNYDGKFTPRITAVVKVAKDNNLRFSYQTAYRFPTNQNQYISLVTGSGTLIGHLREFQDYYKLSSTLPGYTAASVLAYRGGPIADSSKLQRATYRDVVPETVKSFEVGYKGLLRKKLLVDGYVYYSIYDNFLINEAVVQSRQGPLWQIYSPFSSTNVSYVQNSTQEVKALGWGLGIEYALPRNFNLYGNIYSDELRDVPAGAVTFFNAPKYRFNIGLRNDNIFKNFGFNVVVKWQDNNYYEGTFVTGTLPYFAWVDGQVTYRPTGSKSTFRIGGTNLGNNYYRTGFGSPAVGGLYYASYGYNIF
jgi:outer membrane receptor protein involved in Fe transport